MADAPQAEERAPRRLVLLEGENDSAVSQILHEYSGTTVGATRIHADMIHAAEQHPGKVTAVEWLSSIGWKRYLWCRR